MYIKVFFAVLLFSVACGSFFTAVRKSQKNGFYTDTFFLLPLGIFVWGDALILGPFWMISALLFLFLSPLNIIRFLLVFFTFRPAYEVIYWINHQVAQRHYKPPLFSKIEWIDANQAAILYQVLNMCQAVFALFGLVLTFVGR